VEFEVAAIVVAGGVLLVGSKGVPRLLRSIDLARHEFKTGRAGSRSRASATGGTEAH
jgi:Sec-independent protein translocase protein TatA